MTDIANWQRRLLTAKIMFDHGERHRGSSLLLSRLLAVVAYGVAVELLLKAVADKHNIQPGKRDFTIAELLDDVERALISDESIVIRKSDLLKVANIRNNAVHHGIPPSEEAVLECRQSARQFLSDVMRTVFKVNLDTLDISDFIQSSEAKSLLSLAKDNLNAESYFHSRVPAKLAFQIYFEDFLKLLPEQITFRAFNAAAAIQQATNRKMTKSETAIAKVFDQLYTGVSDEIEETKALFGLTTLGHSLEQLRKFDQITSTISFRIGAVSYPFDGGTANTPEQIEKSKWFLEFVADAIFSMEQIGVKPVLSENLEKWYKNVMEHRGKIFS